MTSPILQIVDNPSPSPEVEPISQSPIVQALKSMLASLPEPGHLIRGLTADVIVDLVAERFDLDREVLFSKARPNRIAWPRQVAMYLIRQLLQWTYEDIGDLFNRDHGTAIWACRVVAGQMKSYPKVQAQIIELQNALRIEAGEAK